jgi:hypothetical protein
VSVPSDDRLSSWLSPLRKQAGTGATVPFRNAGPKRVAVLRPVLLRTRQVLDAVLAVIRPQVDAKGEMRPCRHRHPPLPQSSSASRFTADVARAEPFADDALEPELAGVAKHHVARLGDVLIELQAGRCLGQEAGKLGLACLERLAPQVPAVELEQIERG